MVQKRRVYGDTVGTAWWQAGSSVAARAGGSCMLTPQQIRGREADLIKACSVTHALQPCPIFQRFHSLPKQCRKVGTVGPKS